MDDQELRNELAGVTASLRRHLDRERASGSLDLHLSSARRASVAERPPLASSIPAARVAEVVREAPVAELASAYATAGPPGADFLDRNPASTVFELPPVHPPLHSIDPERRLAIHTESRTELIQIAEQVRACTLCGLCQTRTQAVPGVGSAASGIVFVGEAPGADEDRQGEPFVGRAGQLLTQIIQAMDDRKLIPGVKLDRSTVYIANVLKCRPPENRNPLPHEIEACAPYLKRQLAAIQPRIICCLGKFAAELLVGVKGTIGGLRGKVYRYEGAKLIVTYHPAACLRNPGYKRPVWEDMQLLAREYLASGVR